ncbi:MAG: Bug family tripartite tricarboxylate transporter substrate binding protein, partial [Pseudolabrys sp.]
HPSIPANNLKEFIAYAKANPGKLSYASQGAGASGHIAGELLKLNAGLDIVHVPYKGAAPAVNDLLAGHINGVVDNPPIVIAHIKSGALTPLAVAGKERLSVLPDVPTSVEAGLPDWQASSWFGLMAPAGTSPQIVARLQAEVAKALRQPSMQRFVTESGIKLVSNTPDEFAKLIVDERKKWGDIIKAANIPAN